MTPTAEEPRKVTQLLSNPYTKFPEDAYTQGQQEHSLLRYKCPPRDGMLLLMTLGRCVTITQNSQVSGYFVDRDRRTVTGP